MKRYQSRIPATATSACFLVVCMLLTISCSKEKTLEPSDMDPDYFVIHDNPNDPIDHAIYEFYKSTGIAAFYTDTVNKKKVSSEGETPARYSYIKLSLVYSPSGNSQVYAERLSSRDKIPALLKLMQEQVIPKLPSNRIIPSLLLLDTLAAIPSFIDNKISYGWTSIQGFNTIGIQVEDAGAMNTEEKKMYAASLLAGIAAKKINDLHSATIQNDFLSITREVTKEYNLPYDIYLGFPLFLLPPDLDGQPQKIGFLFYPSFPLGGMPFPATPRDPDDIRAYLTAAFYYTVQEFADLHPNETLVLKKIDIIRNLIKEVGFKLPG